MTDAVLTALSALAGALIGSIGGAVAAIVAYKQAQKARDSEERRHVWQLGLELGLKEWELKSQYAVEHGGRIWPPQVFAYHSARFLQLAASGVMTPARYEQLDKEVSELARAIKKSQGMA